MYLPLGLGSYSHHRMRCHVFLVLVEFNQNTFVNAFSHSTEELASLRAAATSNSAATASITTKCITISAVQFWGNPKIPVETISILHVPIETEQFKMLSSLFVSIVSIANWILAAARVGNIE